MSQLITNIALYLTPVLGDSTDFKLILTIYKSDHINGGFPTGSALAFSERSVNDIEKEGWYVFDFGSLLLDPDYYSMVLTQRKNDELPDEEFFKKNFVEWVFSSNITTNKQVYSFSSDYSFTTFPSEGNAYNESYVYGYGYGYGYDDPLDYFNVLGFEGDLLGYGFDIQSNSSSAEYAYGFETVDFISDINIKRNFKIYSNFNDIVFDDVFDFTDQENSKTVFVNLPSGLEEVSTLSNRQDFIIASRNSVDVSGNYISISDSGKRIYSADISSLFVEGSKSYQVDWSESNFYLSVNDCNYADIINPAGNTNRAMCWLVSSNYYSGVYFSTNSGSTWNENISGLLLDDNSVRNISSVKFSLDGDIAIAFDNTNSSEKGCVYVATITEGLIESNSVLWVLVNDLPFGSGGLKGRIINDVIFLSNTEILVGTDNGVYRSLDQGLSWSSINDGLPDGIVVNQISGDRTSGITYGYGYGYGSGLDYFDVLNVDGYSIGYGFDSFEIDFYNSYGYGYGYEYTSEGDSFTSLIFIASENGIYRFNGSFWSQVGGETISQANTILLENNKVYVGNNEGFFRSTDSGDIFVDSFEFEGMSEYDTFYSQGLLKSKTTRILPNISNSQELFVAQHGGVFISSNGGGNFSNISSRLDEKRVKFILTNPLNSRIIYAFVESTKFSNAAVSILLDCSGSMSSNDPDFKRIDMAKEIVSQISSTATSTPFYQLVTFGLSDSEYQKIKNYAQGRGLLEDEFSISGIVNITEGFTSSDTFVLSELENLKSINFQGNQTPLNEAINLISKSINHGGSDFSYENREFEYQIGNIISKRFSESDKILLIITDGFNSTVGKSIEYLIQNNSEFQNLRSKIYIVTVGYNINYEYLNSIKQSRENVNVYLAGFSENLLSEISDIFLEKEQYRERTGSWNKIIKYDEFKNFTKIKIDSNIPPETTVTYKIRASKDKDIWTDWIENLTSNQDNIIDLFGKYFQIQITLNTILSSCSPEIKQIQITHINPKESFIFYKSKETDTEKEIFEFQINSIDDCLLGNFTTEEVVLNFGFLESDSTNYDFYKELPHGKRMIVKRKNWENLITEDGFFYVLEGGAWPQDFGISVFDATEGIQDLTEPISSSKYFCIPSLGRIIFFEKQGLSKIYKSKFTNTNSVYRVGAKVTNYTDEDKTFKMHDIAWTYYDDPRTTTTQRNPLPLVSSQLGEGDVFGRISPSNLSSTLNSTGIITAQYINRSENSFSNGVVSLTNGLRINLSTDEDLNSFKFYKQNLFLEPYNVISPSGQNYVSINVETDNFSISNSDSEELLFQINTTYSSKIFQSNGSMTIILGDTSFGGTGINTYFYQENLLFDKTEKVVGEIETTFIIGDSNDIGTIPSVSLVEGSENSDVTANDSDFNGFDKPLSPNLSFCGSVAVKGVVIAPTTVSAGTPFKINVLAVDSLGLISRSYLGTVNLEFDSSGFGSFDQSSYEFLEEDNGSKVITVSTQESSSGFVRILLKFNGSEYKSNPIKVQPMGSITNIYWGDFNVPTIHSDGRQSIEFIKNYSKNISQISFLGTSDDIDSIDQEEWDFIKKETLDQSTDEIILIPGIRHRSQDYFGERVVLFGNFDDIPDTKPTSPKDLSSAKSQIEQLISDIRDYDVISYPVHTAYENDQSSTIFNSRGFDFENYRTIMSYSPVSDSSDFISIKESAIEIFSDHGGIQNQTEFVNENFSISQNSQYVNYALQMGKKFAFISNSGGYSSRPGYYLGDRSSKVTLPSISSGNNRGITAVITSNISRENVFNALKNRSCYATTGARIYLEFQAFYGDIPIGIGKQFKDTSTDTTTLTPLKSISFKFRAAGDNSNISRFQIVKLEVDNFNSFKNILDTFSTSETQLNKVDFGSDSGDLTFIETEISNQGVSGKEYVYYLKVTQFNGHVAWSSPIWIDFGRESGIRNSEDSLKNKIYKIALIEDASSSNNFGIVSNAPLKENSEGFPLNHFDIISLRPSFTPKDTRVTPYITPESSNVSLMVSDKRCSFSGFRVSNYSDFNIFYGTHYMKTIGSEDDYKSENIISLNDSKISNLNGDTVQGFYDEKYKFLNSESDIIPTERSKKYRDWFFGTMWQYISSSNFRFGYTLEKTSIFSSLIPDAFVVKDPFIYRDGADYKLFYSGHSGKYPLQKDVLNNKYLLSQSTIVSSLPDTVRELNQREEFLGLINTSESNSMSGGENIRIMYANDDGFDTRNFFKKNVVPNTFGGTANGTTIYYSYCPNYIKISNTDHRIYYLGWFYGQSNSKKPVLGLFCYRFSDINNLDTTGSNVLTFAFTNSSEELPKSYSPRRSSFESNNFFPSDIREDAFNSDFWFETHPAYASRWLWLSVVQQDGGDFYAFFNYMNQIDSKIYIGQDNPGTGILYSNDVSKLVFRQFDLTQVKNIPSLSGKVFFHPFKVSENSQTNWYSIYRNIDSSGSNISEDVFYSRFNWIPEFLL